ncbi:vascular endothelial growth factor receptor 3 [Boleophthalmus pectinirostris]|uniref:vascular endothelial growth factor receptor 3 n=1 Tax=Boleophthalmus pectinirostris TaxID=150288 RepID=UPI00242F92A6|nr:vascular endothelial growth factor receptor 3 [Boleophthalmus pectinirostris]
MEILKCMVVILWNILATSPRRQAGLVIGFSIAPPSLDIPKDDLVIPVYETLRITCRGQLTLAWAWPDQTLVAQELNVRQGQQLPSSAPHRQRGVVVSECEGQPGRPYCKRLVLRGAQAKDTGYYRCYYTNVKAIIEGTTAISVYVFIRDPEQPFLLRTGQNSDLETLLITRLSTHVTVPCLVTVPDLNVTLHAYPTPLEKADMKWNNKLGWTVPRHVVDNPLVIGVMCVATLNGKDYQSVNYLIHTVGSHVYDVKLFPEDPVELMVGETLTLNCTALVEFNTGVDIKWTYPGAESTSVPFIHPYREILSHATEAASILTIPSVNMSDTGTYSCNVTSMDSSHTQLLHVTVHEKPFIILGYRNGPVVEVTAGQKSVKINVNVSAYPTPETKWYKDGKLINQRPEFKIKRIRMHPKHVLEIRDVCREDAGLYTVVLRNSAAGLEQRLNITLVVNVVPQIHEKEVAEPSSPYPSGSSHVLTCTAFGLPTPSVTWHWRDWGPCVLNSSSTMGLTDSSGHSDRTTNCHNWQDVIPQNTGNQIEAIETSIEVVDGRQKIVSRLHIQNATVSVMYKCTAENKVGQDERLIYFYVTTIPEGFSVSVLPSEGPQEQDRVSLCCSADNYTYERLQWYRLHPQALPQELECRSVHLYAEMLHGQLSFQAESNSWVLDHTIASIQLRDEGHYVCEAQSRRTGDKQCLFRYISVKDEPPAFPMLTGAFALQCNRREADVSWATHKPHADLQDSVLISIRRSP